MSTQSKLCSLWTRRQRVDMQDRLDFPLKGAETCCPSYLSPSVVSAATPDGPECCCPVQPMAQPVFVLAGLLSPARVAYLALCLRHSGRRSA
jgi:hypothetical protein